METVTPGGKWTLLKRCLKGVKGGDSHSGGGGGLDLV